MKAFTRRYTIAEELERCGPLEGMHHNRRALYNDQLNAIPIFVCPDLLQLFVGREFFTKNKINSCYHTLLLNTWLASNTSSLPFISIRGGLQNKIKPHDDILDHMNK